MNPATGLIGKSSLEIFGQYVQQMLTFATPIAKYPHNRHSNQAGFYIWITLMYLITGEVYSAQCISTPSFLVVGCLASSDSVSDICTTDSVSLTTNKFQLTGYFKLEPDS